MVPAGNYGRWGGGEVGGASLTKDLNLFSRAENSGRLFVESLLFFFAGVLEQPALGAREGRGFRL